MGDPTGMRMAVEFERAVELYQTKAVQHGPADRVAMGYPDKKYSRLSHGVWYLRDARGHLLARVSSRGVRFAGWGIFAA